MKEGKKGIKKKVVDPYTEMVRWPMLYLLPPGELVRAH